MNELMIFIVKNLVFFNFALYYIDKDFRVTAIFLIKNVEFCQE